MVLDFSILTDDQLVDLIRAACADAVRRGGAVKIAAEAAVLDEAEKARIAAQARARAMEELKREEAARIARETAEQVKEHVQSTQRKTEQEKVAQTWEYKDQIGAQLAALLKPKRAITLKVWLRGADKRVYIGGGYDDNDVTYYHAGNHKMKPGTIEIATRDLQITKEEVAGVKVQLLPILEAICQKWNTITIPIPVWDAVPQEVA